MKSSINRRSLKSLFFRMLWLQVFVPVLLIALLGIGAAAYYGGQSYHAQELELTRTMGYVVEEYLNDAAGVLNTLAASADTTNLDELDLTLNLLRGGLNSFDVFYAIDSQGIVQIVSPHDPQVQGLDWSRQHFFIDSRSSPLVTISNPFISVRSNNMAVTLAKQMPNGWVLAGELNLNELQRIVQASSMQRARGSAIFVTDSAGNLLAHPDLARVARQENVSDLPIVRRHTFARGQVTSTYWYQGGLYLGGATRVENSGWLVVSQAPAARVFFPYSSPALLVLGAAVVLAAIFVRRIFHKMQHLIATPLDRLRSVTSQVAAGHDASGRALQAVPKTFNELAHLVHDFSLMNDAIQKRTQELQFLAAHDRLTRLANRSHFRDEVLSLIEKDSRQQRRFALLFIDLDNFKSINDAFGHASGDFVLCRVADLLAEAGRGTMLVGRLGGDEFAVVQRVRYTREAAALADHLLDALNQPIQIDHNQVYISPSIGISFFPEDGDQADMLIQKADTAMNHAKREGKNGYQTYSLAMETQAQERHAYTTHLHHALEFNELSLVFQPIVHTGSRRWAGCEALLRWKNPRLGSVPPGKFIPLANDTGLILPIGEWILRSACEQALAFSQPGEPVWVSVNIAERQLKHHGFVTCLENVLAGSGLPAAQLRLELTEDIVFQHFQEINDVLNAVKALGITLSLDDFGTGYSTLSCLTQIPFDVIKIDRSLVRQVTYARREAAIVSGILRISKDLGMQVVAEGIESEAEIAFFERLGCDLLQGFYFSKPLPPGEISAARSKQWMADSCQRTADSCKEADSGKEADSLKRTADSI